MTRRWDVRPYLGNIMIGLFFLHTAVALAAYWGPIREIVRAGIFNASGSDPERDGAVWFVYVGVMFLLVGILARWTYAQTKTYPKSFAWSFIAISVVGLILVPISGFWLLLGLGFWLLRSIG